MARVREETLTHGTRMGTLRGLAVTGAVITSAGIVLAGTFSALAVLPAGVPHRDRLRHRLRRACWTRSWCGPCSSRASRSTSGPGSGGRRGCSTRKERVSAEA
jgi:hypothetical protein